MTGCSGSKSNLSLLYYREADCNYNAPDFDTTAPRDLRALRLVSEDLNSTQALDEASEVRGDAQSSGSVVTGINVAGSVQIQYSLDTFDDLIAGMLYAPNGSGTNRELGWVVDGFAAVADILNGTEGFTVTLSANVLTCGGGNWTTQPAAGDRIYLKGSGNRNLDTVFQVASSTATTITLLNDTGDTDVQTYAGDAGVAFAANQITISGFDGYTHNGTNEHRFGLVRIYSDASAIDSATAGAGTGATDLTAVDWALFRGMIPTGFSFAAAPGTAGWTGAVPFIGKDEVCITDATTAGGNPGTFAVNDWDEIAKLGQDPLVDAINGPVMVRLKRIADGSYTRVDPLSFSVTMSNGATEIPATRNAGSVATTQGTFTASVNLQLLYINCDFHERMLNNEFFEVEVGIADGSKAQIWRFGKCRYSSTRPNPGRNAAVVQTLEFAAEPSGERFINAGLGSTAGNTDGHTVQVMRSYTATAT